MSNAVPSLTWGEIYNNYNLVTSALYTINRTPSVTNVEFERKFEVQERMQKGAQRWAKGVQFTTFGGLVYFCLTSRFIKTKVTCGFLYTYWLSHFYQLGSHLGVFVNLKGAADMLNMDEEYTTGKAMSIFIKKVRDRDEQRVKHHSLKSEQSIIKELWEEQLGQKEVKEIYERSYTQNNYYSKNLSKYVDTGSDNQKSDYSQNSQEDDHQRLRFIPEAADVFLVRYIYFNFARWLSRFGMYLGIKKE